MPDLFNQLSQPALLAQQVWYVVPVLVLLASLLGSTHCVAMCGGIVMALPPQKSAQSAYHLGRLLGYLMLGGVAGFAGQFLLYQSHWLSRAATAFMALVLLALAWQVWRGQSLHLQLPGFVSAWIQKLTGRALQQSRQQPWLGSLAVGWLSMFLPCGWLYTFVLGALVTGSLWLGALYLTAFWAGSVPLLAVGPALLSRWLQQRTTRQRQVVASLFLLAGLFTLSGFWGRQLPIDARHLADPSQPLQHHHHGHGGHSPASPAPHAGEQPAQHAPQAHPHSVHSRHSAH